VVAKAIPPSGLVARELLSFSFSLPVEEPWPGPDKGFVGGQNGDVALAGPSLGSQEPTINQLRDQRVDILGGQAGRLWA
jgi:hypothetical protein